MNDEFYKKLEDFRLGDAFGQMVQVPCYKVPTITEPNGHLYVAWRIPDAEAMTTTFESMMENYAYPAMQALANEVNEYGVAMVTSLATDPGAGRWSKCYEDNLVPVRMTVAYESGLLSQPAGHIFTMDIMSDLLNKDKK